MKNTIAKLTKEAELKYSLVVRTENALAIYYSETGRDDASSFHYQTKEQFMLGLINLVDTGHAGLSENE
jgi:hypothetical protein